ILAYEGASPNNFVNRTTMKNANDEEEIPLDILAADPPAKLYLLVGTNALASGTKDESFLNYYGRLLDDLKSIGISIEGDKLHLSGDWTPTAIGGEEHGISLGNYAEFTHHSDHGDITILVQSGTPATDDLAQQIVQNTLNHGQG
uniref:hypothetical protein n=1 Tax=uncultured Bilophila sp. TaxID=529385 RepID=UPI0025921970